MTLKRSFCEVETRDALVAMLLPDEIDVIVEASTEAPGWHLVQPENRLVWICDPAGTGKA